MKKKKKGLLFDLLNGAVLTLVALVTLYPFLYVVFASFSDPLELMSNSGLLFAPMGFSLDAYVRVFENPSIYSGYANTIFYVVVGTLVNIIATCMAAYVLSRKQLSRIVAMSFCEPRS